MTKIVDQRNEIKEIQRLKKEITESIVDKVIEGVSIAVVGELVIGGRKLLEALRRYAGEVACELRVLGQDHRPTRHEAVDQRLLPHPRDAIETLGERKLNQRKTRESFLLLQREIY